MIDIVGNRTIRSVWDEAVELYPNSVFMEFISKKEKVTKYTYREFDKLVNKVANLFVENGIQQDELVAIHLHNSPEYLISWLALAKIGAVAVPLNEHYSIREVSHIIRHCKITKVVANKYTLPMYIEHSDLLNIGIIFSTFNNEHFNNSIINLSSQMHNYSSTFTYNNTIINTSKAVILFTSGTTGLPKGAIYTHYNVVFGGIFHVWQMGMRTGDKFLTAMPCYHMDFQQMSAMPVITVGGTIVVVEHFSARRFWKQIVDHEANFTDIMSTMNRTMMLQPKYDWEKNHKLVGAYFSMGLSDFEKNNFESRFNIKLSNSYGMTETVTAVTCAPFFGNKKWPSVGRPALTYKIKIINENGEELENGEMGEICVWGEPGKTIVAGYYDDIYETNKLIDSEGWIHTGDRGYCDDDGNLYFVDRMGHLIKRSGENVSPLEVECVINSYPKVSDCAVIGIPDHIRDESVKAFITVVKDENIDLDDLKEYCSRNLAKFKVPQFWEIVDAFPRTSTGKIKKNVLKEKYQ